MIPLALTLKGFLSFRDEQRLDFEHDQVWLLSGPNGSGKSAVFDAILFALYAGHRAGKSDLHELINKSADRARVCFEFLLDGRRYRAERTADRTTDRKTGRAGYTSTQQLCVAQEGAESGWQQIAGTQRQGDFQEWVREHVGLSFDAFTSSALLMQGRADVLVAQDAEAARRRFEVLARIVGLDFYERLHRQADDLRKRNEKRVQELQAQLEVVEPVEPATLDALAERARDLAEQLAGADRNLDRLHAQKIAAAKWLDLERLRADKQREWDSMTRLLGDAATIERDGLRWHELQGVLPALKRVLEQRKQVADAEAAVAELERNRKRLHGGTLEVDGKLGELQLALDELEHARAADEQKRQELVAAQQERTLAQGPLRRLHRHRHDMSEADAAATQAGELQRGIEAEAAGREQDLAVAAAALQAAVTAHREAAETAAAAKTRLDDLQEQSDRLAEVSGASLCRYCGQSLTAEHAARERERIDRELSARRAHWNGARKAVESAAATELRCRRTQQAADKALVASRKRAEEVKHDRERARGQVRAHLRGVQDAFADLAAPYQARISAGLPADWTATVFPRPEDLARLDAELAEIAKQLQSIAAAAAKGPSAAAGLRKQQQEASAERTRLQQALHDVERRLAQHAERIALGRQQLEPACAALPQEWQARLTNIDETHVQVLDDEYRLLTRQDAGPRLDRLRAARAGQDPLRWQLEQLDADLQQVPEDCRCDPASFEPALRAAKQHENGLRVEWSNVEAQQRHLQEVQARREKLADDHRAADRRRYLSTRLAELLSRRQLQRHLLRQAEDGIVENANRVLDRVTGGTLCVRLLPEEDNDDSRALQLEAHKPATGQSFGLSFLSGSERFRVAIGLALGIGQYASRRHRAIESVIIDEGFGCLDRDNRRTMIDELDHLRGQLRCILLVSHQEEFADAFPDGYRFRFADGTSRVERSD